MQVCPHMLTICSGSPPKTWTIERTLPVYPTHPTMPSVGRFRLRPCSLIIMNYFDIHTHSVPPQPSQAIVSVDVTSLPMNENIVHASVGIHPWYLTKNDENIRLQELQTCIHSGKIIAIGEAGLDKLKGPSLNVQTSVFRQEIALAEKHHLPMIIHCVRMFNELIQLKKELAPQQPWIIHGFRGKASVAQELLRHSCWLSFGSNYQEEALQITPAQRLFIETDESEEPIESIYFRIAKSRGISAEELAETVKKNILEVFFKV